MTTHLDVDLTKETAEELRLKKPLLSSVTVSLPIMLVKEVENVITLNRSLSELKTLQIAK